MAVSIAMESVRQPDVARLIEDLDTYQQALYPIIPCHLLGLEALSADNVRVFVARENGEALGCGALQIDRAQGHAELRRMYVLPRARGRDIGRQLLASIESQARIEHCHTLRLETGIRQPEALGLYRAAGFVECAPFDADDIDPHSVYMEKTL